MIDKAPVILHFNVKSQPCVGVDYVEGSVKGEGQSRETVISQEKEAGSRWPGGTDEETTQDWDDQTTGGELKTHGENENRLWTKTTLLNESKLSNKSKFM